MKIEGTYTFDAPREAVWSAFLDPEILARTLPGCEKLERTDENEFSGVIKVQVGPVQGQFQGKVRLSNLNPPDSYHMSVNGRGPAGFVKGEGDIDLQAQDGTTLMIYGGDVQVGGRLASVGQRLIDSTAKALTRQSLESLNRQIQAALVPTEPEPVAEAKPVEEEAVESAAVAVSPAPAKAAPSGSNPSDGNGMPAEASRVRLSGPLADAPSQTQFAVDVARDVLDDLLPPEKRSNLIVIALFIMAAFFFSEWWLNRLANRIASIIEQQAKH